MSNKSKRFSVQGLFSKGTSSHAEPASQRPRQREASRSIKNKEGKRLTVYIPDEPLDMYTQEKVSKSQQDPSNEVPFPSKKDISPEKASSSRKDSLLSYHTTDSKVTNTQFTDSMSDHHETTHPSSESSSSTYQSDLSRNLTMSSSIYSALPSSAVNHRSSFMPKLPIHPSEDELLKRSITSRNPTLLRKRKPPPKPFTKPTSACQENVLENLESTVVVPGIKSDLPAIDTKTELEIPSNGPPSAIESQCSPLHLNHQEASNSETSLNFTEPQSNLPVIDISNQLVRSPFQSESIKLHSEVASLDNDDSIILAKSSDDVIDTEQNRIEDRNLEEDSEESSSFGDSVPQIKMHIPSLKETISRDRSPEFEISNNFSSQTNVKILPAHKHSRTISSIEDITNVIDSFQLTHSVLSEEQEKGSTDNESYSSHKIDLTSSPKFEMKQSNLLTNASPEMENTGLFLKVGDLPELEEGQTLENYIENLERDIAKKKVSASSPIKASSYPQPLKETAEIISNTQNLIPPKFISDKENDVSENSSITDVFYEANETPKLISSKRMAFDDLVSDESSVETSMHDIQQSPPPPYTTMSANSVGSGLGIHQGTEDDQASVTWKEYRANDDDMISGDHFAIERGLGLEDEIENTVHESIPEIESYEDLYPDEISDESIEESSIDEAEDEENRYSQDSDDDGMLEFTPKSPMSDKFLLLDQNSGKRSWIVKTPEPYRSPIDSSDLEDSPGHSSTSQNKTHLIVINGSPSSASVSNNNFQFDKAQLEVPPLLPVIPSQSSLNREQSYTTITSNNQLENLQYTADFPIYDRREEPSVSPIQYSAVVTPVAPLLKKPLGNVKRPPPDFPTGGRRSRGLSTTNNNPEFFSETQNEVLAAVDSERPGRGQRSVYVEKLRADARVVNTDKLPSSMLPISLRITKKQSKKTFSGDSRSNSASTSTLLFSASRPKPRMLASEMDDNELPNATQLHSGKTKVPVHPDAEVLAASEEFKKIAALNSPKSTSASNVKRKDSIVSVAPNIQRMKLYIVNPDSD